MAIVPSGTRRLVKLQQSNTSNTNPPARNAVEQEDILSPGASDKTAGDFNPIGQLGQSLQKQKSTQAPNVPNQQDLQDAVGTGEPEVTGKPVANSDQDSAQTSGSESVGDDFRDAYFKVMESLGIEPRMFNHPQHADKFFHIDEEVIGSGQAKGFFILPSKTQAKAVEKQEAWNIAKKLGSEFGVTKMNFSYAAGNNYKFTFQVLVEDNSSMTNSSLDSLITGGKSQMGKAAFSKNSLIKESRNGLVNSLIKQGFGGTK